MNGNFKGDMGEVLGYPQCEERGRLGVQGKSRSKPPPPVQEKTPPVQENTLKGQGREGSGGVGGVGPPNWTGASRGIRGRCRGIPGVKKGGG